MRARSLHATSLGLKAELPRNELIAALTPAEARALLYEWAFGYGSCLRAVASARREPARK
jgi:hypothetical protein